MITFEKHFKVWNPLSDVISSAAGNLSQGGT